jgi:hypothetical protein
MAYESTESKKHLALDTDWMTALFAAVCFMFCLMSVVVTTKRVLTGAPVQMQVTWDTVFALLAFTWLAFQTQERVAKFGCGLLSLVFGSRLILKVVHCSDQIQALNGQIMRVVELLVTVGFCFYLGLWFKQRIRRV